MNKFSLVLLMPFLFCTLLFWRSTVSASGLSSDSLGPYGHEAKIKFRHVVNEKLSDLGRVRTILEDDYGFMWVLGDRGVARFDGVNLKLFRGSSEGQGELPSRLLGGLVKDKYGDIWLHANAGFFLYDRSLNRFNKVDLDLKKNLGLDGNISIASVHASRDGSLWIGFYGQGFVNYNHKERVFTHFNQSTSTENKLTGVHVITMLEDSQGNLWVGTLKGLARYNINDKTFTSFTHSASDPSSISAEEIVVLHEDRDGNIWVGTGRGLIRYLGDGDRFKRYGESDKQTVRGFISSIAESKAGALWFSTDKSGIGYYQSESDSFVEYRANEWDSKSIENDSVTEIYLDSSGLLWAGYYPYGLSFVDPYASSFITYTYNPDDSNSLSNNTINALAKGYDNELWVGTELGLNHLDLNSGKVERYIHNSEDNTSLTANGVISVLQDSSGRVWVGTWLGGLNLLNQTDGTFQSYKYKLGDAASLTDNVVWSILERNKNSLWVGTRRGLSILDIPSGGFQRLTYSSESVRGMIDLSEDELLVMHLNSLVILDKNTLEPKSVVMEGWDQLAPVDGIYFTQNEDVLFVSKNGVHRWNRGANRVEHLPNKNRDLLRSYWQIVEDSQGVLWMGADSGVKSFNPVTEESTLYTSDHGLPGNSFTRKNAALILDDGRVAMGGAEGMVVFNPNSVYRETLAPRTILTQLTVLDQVVSEYGKQSPLDKSIELATNIVLNDDQRVFSLEFTSLEFQLPKHTQYFYRLVGFDDDWRSAGSRRLVTYTNLDPGDYLFEVKSKSDSGLWSRDNATLTITVLPPWSRTWWAYILYVFLVLAVVSLFIYVIWTNQQRLRERKISEKLIELDQLKDAFLANTSHELRTPLHGIIGLSELILEDDSDVITARKKENLRLISSSAKRLSSLINDILDFSKLKDTTIHLCFDAVNLRPLVAEVVDLIRPLIIDKPLTLENNVPADLPLIRADKNRLQQVLSNLIGNAIKFTEQGRVTISATISGSNIEVYVSDTGIGIPQDKVGSVFQQFEQVDGSIERRFGGTGLGLTITKQLVELHGGSISLSSALGQGTTFTFTMQISDVTEASALSSDGDDSSQSMPLSTFNSGVTSTSEPAYKGERPLKEANWKNEEVDLPTRILVVDDELVNRRILEDCLALKSYDYISCENGADVVSLLTSDGALGDIDLVLLDVMMPGLSGLDVCQKIRQHYSREQLPIIFLTAKTGVDDIEKGYEAGGNDYLKKPFSKIELLLRIDFHLELSRKNLSLERIVKKRTLELQNSNSCLQDSNTKLLELQSHLVQSEKMSSLGVLVSGVGHEINNPVNFISTAAYNLKQDIAAFYVDLLELAGEDADRDVIEGFDRHFNDFNNWFTSIEDGIGRVNDVISDLRSFSRSGGKQMSFLALGKGIQSTLNLVKSNYKSTIRFETDIQADPLMKCDQSEINQVLMNLMVNACQALLQKAEKVSNDPIANEWTPTLWVRTYVVGRQLVTEVEDNGAGMTHDVKCRVFDPFFTTKKDGEGTGLGLSISHGIIRRHSGSITVDSVLDEGTLFKILLPIAEE